MAHLKTGRGNAAGVGSFSRGVKNSCLLEHLNTFRRCGHIRTLANSNATILDKRLGIFFVDLILRCARKSRVALYEPRPFSCVIFTAKLIRVFLDAAALDVLKLKDKLKSAAIVLATLVACAQLDAPVKVTGLMGLVENMVSGEAYKPGDVLKSRSGKTVEVLNTDAEGRLVLADALTLPEKRGPTFSSILPR